MKVEREFLVGKLKEAGIRGRVYESVKDLKNSNSVQAGAVLRVEERFVRSGSKKRFEDNEGRRRQRNRLFERETVLHVVIADSDEDKVDAVFTRFLSIVSKGFPVDGNWVDIEIGDADWLEKNDTILKSCIVVEFDVTLHGGIYSEDTEIKTPAVGVVAAGSE